MTPGFDGAVFSQEWKEAKIAKATLVRFEKGGNVMLFGYLRLKEAYEARGVRFEGKTGVHVEER